MFACSIISAGFSIIISIAFDRDIRIKSKIDRDCPLQVGCFGLIDYI